MRNEVHQPIPVDLVIRRRDYTEKAERDADPVDSAALEWCASDQEKGKRFFSSRDERPRPMYNQHSLVRNTVKMTILLLCLHAAASLASSTLSSHEAMKRNLIVADNRIQDTTNFRQPRILQIDSDLHTIQNLDQHEYITSSHEVHVSKRERRTKERLNNSKKYDRHSLRDPIREGDCEAMHAYQETSFPSCNLMHEVNMVQQMEVLTEGGFNTVYKMTDIDETTHIVKILESDKDFTDRNFDRVRRDSVIMERASGSDYVVDIYSYCGFSQVVEYGRHGNLDDMLDGTYGDLSQSQKLQIATQVAQALADVHDLDDTGISSMSHGDFLATQYILIDGHFKLNDFNRGRFIRWNSKLQEPCTYRIGYNDKKFRSPEEYKYIPETAAIDVWALGSIFVEIVSGQSAWHGYKDEAAQQEIVNGKLPPFQQYIQTPSDPINQVLLKAIEMCYIYDAKDRPKAGVVLEYLKKEAKRLGVEWNKPFVNNRGLVVGNAKIER
ncbi:unnamed protein product [Cylindrotheca closterium]|uniref:Protein kinase domain-containing protein n=1 Tax=Cylindrotheca closterium TaxID=2856 RepID=A0AAD2JP33_9STRA|nr:unnamed protein product [Cylindrotheca closterium]